MYPKEDRGSNPSGGANLALSKIKITGPKKQTICPDCTCGRALLSEVNDASGIIREDEAIR
jgi:hypothetical protein